MDNFKPLTPFGLEKKKGMQVYKVKEDLIIELQSTEKIICDIKKHGVLFSNIERILSKFKDIRNTLKRCKNSDVLDDIELYEIKYFCICLSELREEALCLNLDIQFTDLSSVTQILDPKNMKIPTFYIYEEYSEVLKDIRIKKLKIENQIFKETDVHKIDVHKIDMLKNERLKWVVRESEEEINIRKMLSVELSPHISELEKNIINIGVLDFLIAKGNLIIKFNGIKPNIINEREVSFVNMVNPFVMDILSHKNKKITPINIELKNGVSVITGANMGGKTVTLKTLTLNILLGHMGFFVFCESGKFPVFDFINFISDDMQSVSKGLSSFGAEIIEINELLENVKKGTGFIVLDEVARGTNPREGKVLVKALCKYLDMQKSISIVSTHYDGITQNEMIHYEVRGLRNVSLENLKEEINREKQNSIKILQEHMDYTLEKIDSIDSVPKEALNICTLLGMDEKIIESAKEMLLKNI